MKEVLFDAVVAAADHVDQFLPVAKQRLANMGVPPDHEQAQALEGLTVGVHHVEPDFGETVVYLPANVHPETHPWG